MSSLLSIFLDCSRSRFLTAEIVCAVGSRIYGSAWVHSG